MLLCNSVISLLYLFWYNLCLTISTNLCADIWAMAELSRVRVLDSQLKGTTQSLFELLLNDLCLKSLSWELEKAIWELLLWFYRSRDGSMHGFLLMLDLSALTISLINTLGRYRRILHIPHFFLLLCRKCFSYTFINCRWAGCSIGKAIDTRASKLN